MPNTNPGVSDNVTVTVRMSSASCAAQVTTTLFLEESEIISIGTISLTNASVCTGQIPGNISSTALASATISGTTINYRWQERTNLPTSTWVDIPGSRGSSSTLSFVGVPLMQSTLFRRNVISSVNGQSCTTTGTQVLISVTAPPSPTLKDPALNVVSAPSTYSICEGEPIEFRASGGRSYQFKINGAVRYTVGSSNTTDEIVFDPLANASHNIINTDFVEVRVYNLPLTVGNAIDSNACYSDTNSVTFSVTASLSPTVVANNIVGNTFCSGETVSFTVGSIAAVPSPTYEYSINGSAFTTVSGTTFTYTMPNTILGVSDNVTVTVRMSSGACSAQVTTTLFLEESEAISLGTISATTTAVCIGKIPGVIQSTALASATISGTIISYRWQQRTDTLTSTWLDIPGARGATSTLSFTGVPLTESSLFRRNVILLANGQSCTNDGLQVVRIGVTPGPSGTLRDRSVR